MKNTTQPAEETNVYDSAKFLGVCLYVPIGYLLYRMPK